MKIHEIVTEERTDEVLGTVLRGIGALARGAKTGVQNIGARPIARAGEIAARYRGLPGWMAKWARGRDLKALKAARVAYKTRAANVAADALGDEVLKWVTRAAIIDGIYDYYTASYFLEDQLKDGKISQEEHDKALTELRGQFIASILVPRLAGGATKITTGLVGGIVSKLGGTRSGEAIRFWGGTVAKIGEASALALLSTDAGKKWLTESMTLLVTGLGHAGNLIADFMALTKAAAQVATGILPKGYEPSIKTDKDGNIDFGKDPWKGTGRDVGIL